MRPIAVLTLAIAALSSPAAQAGPAAWMTGVNLSCAEYNGNSTRINFDYTYPTRDEIAYYARKGLRTFRVPVLTSRILSGTATNGGGADWQALMGVIAAAAAFNGTVILDVHQYGSMPSGLVGHDAAATAEFVTAWSEIAKRLRTAPNVVFGLMNEPNKQSAAEWLAGANAAVAAIRKAGARQLVLVPGSYWDGAATWTNTDNAKVMTGLKDPANNVVFEVHQYLDPDNSGTSPAVVPGKGKASLAAFTAWARSHRVRAFLGEFGFAAAPDAMAEGHDLLAFMAANRDVWRGWTYWAGGPWWGDYMFSVEPKNSVDKPQMSVLAQFK